MVPLEALEALSSSLEQLPRKASREVKVGIIPSVVLLLLRTPVVIACTSLQQSTRRGSE